MYNNPISPKPPVHLDDFKAALVKFDHAIAAAMTNGGKRTSPSRLITAKLCTTSSDMACKAPVIGLPKPGQSKHSFKHGGPRASISWRPARSMHFKFALSERRVFIPNGAIPPHACAF